MKIHITVDIKYNYLIITFFKSYIAVDYRLIKNKAFWICHHFPPRVYSIMYPELVEPALDKVFTHATAYTKSGETAGKWI